MLFHYTLKDIILYVFHVLYFILCTYLTGTTLGKRAMNLRVVSADWGQRLSLWMSCTGRLWEGSCSLSIGIGYIIVGLTGRSGASMICCAIPGSSMLRRSRYSRYTRCQKDIRGLRDMGRHRGRCLRWADQRQHREVQYREIQYRGRCRRQPGQSRRRRKPRIICLRINKKRRDSYYETSRFLL